MQKIKRIRKRFHLECKLLKTNNVRFKLFFVKICLTQYICYIWSVVNGGCIHEPGTDRKEAG